MRKNTQVVLNALKLGQPCRKCEAVHTDGQVVKSYSTVVALPDPDNKGHWLVADSGEYSQTTTVQTNGLAIGLEEMGHTVTRVPASVMAKTARRIGL